MLTLAKFYKRALRAKSRKLMYVTMTTADGGAMAISGEEASAALDGREIKGDAISLQEAFLQFKRKKQVSDPY